MVNDLKITASCNGHEADVTTWDNDYTFAGKICPDSAPEIVEAIANARKMARDLADITVSFNLTSETEVDVYEGDQPSTRTLIIEARKG